MVMRHRVCDEMGSGVQLGAFQRGMVSLKKKKKNPLSLSIVVFPTSLFPFSSVLSHSKCIHKSYTINASSRAAELNQRKQTLFSGSSSILREGLTFRKADSLGEK